MKAFLASVAVAIAIAVVAGFGLHALDWSSSDMFQASHGSVRL